MKNQTSGKFKLDKDKATLIVLFDMVMRLNTKLNQLKPEEIQGIAHAQKVREEFKKSGEGE